MPENFDEICANIKACLNSSQRQTSLSELNRDYKSVLGDSIPFRSVGYNSLEQLIRAIPDLKICHIGNELFVDVKPDEKTMHITNLVRGQKKEKKKSKGSKYGKSVYRAPLRRTATPPKTYYKSYNNNNNNINNRGNSYKSRPHGREDYSHNNNSRNDQNWISKYRSTRPSELDFSDHDHNDFDDYDDSTSDDCVEVIAPIRHEVLPSKRREEMKEMTELNSELNKLHVTLGNSRKVSVEQHMRKERHLPKSNSNDDDVGYSSMNDVNTFANDHTSNSTRLDLEIGDYEPITIPRKVCTKRTPASIVAAGRALIEIREPTIMTTPEKMNKSLPHQALNVIDDLIYGQPFKSANRQSTNMKNTDVNIDALLNSVPMKHSPTSPTAVKTPNKKKVLPSKMSDPNMFVSGPNLPPKFSGNTLCSRLRSFTVKNNLPLPVFMNFTKYDPKTNTTSYMCKVKIDNNLSFTSCPFESSCLSEVQEHVAKLAYEELSRRHENIDSAALPISCDTQKMVSRISEIVSSHPTGLKSETIETQYKLLHQEILPYNWLYTVKELSLLSVEQLVGGVFVYPSSEATQLSSNVTTLPTLILPETDSWNIFVTCCNSTNHIYFRIIHDNYNGRLEKMEEKMEEIYGQEESKLRPVDIVKESNYYVAHLDNHWFRVKVLATPVGEKVKVSLIDHGDVDDIPKNCVYPLDEQLTDVPAQAVRCALTDLEEYSNQPYISKTLHNLIFDKAVVGRVDFRNPTLLLTLFDTSTTEDINLNDYIKEKAVKELSPPKLPGKNVLTDVHLTSVLEDGFGYVQLISDSYKFLRSLLANTNQVLAKDEKKYVVKSPNELIGGEIFLVKYAEDNMWHRALINSIIQESNEVEVAFIDYGNVEIVPLENIADIKHFTEVLGVIPPQAVQVQFIKPTAELFTQTIIEFLMRMAAGDKDEESLPRIFVMKVVQEKSVPDVELFVRLPDSNKLVSVNDIIGSYYPEYRGPAFSGIKLSSVNSILSKKNCCQKKTEKNVMSLLDSVPEIKPFPVPLAPNQFNVHIVMVSNPSHIIVRPCDYQTKLQNLMVSMNKFYQDEQPMVSIDDLKEGHVYAVQRQTDKLWCRGIVLRILSDLNSISMKLLDYGDVISVKYTNILHLLPCFRSLPSLAIKAELANVAPMFGDWNITDCLRLQELISQKNLASLVLKDYGDNHISFLLYDTSLKDQADIGAILVDEKHAAEVDLAEL